MTILFEEKISYHSKSERDLNMNEFDSLMKEVFET